MTRLLPVISVVVPSFNQGSFLRETLQSLVDQSYAPLEVIIQDGGSEDGSVALAEEYVRQYPSIFRLYVEKDAGQADALNRGFARANGEILAFLSSDDTYYPRILHRVAATIDPSRGRYVIMGRCLFTGDGSRYAGIEHPAEYISHFDHLAVWKRGFNTIPQPAVFWHRSVWERCGGFDINEDHVLDYDLFCRFSRHYRFHKIDELFSTYRMHDRSKSSQRTEAEVLELTVRVSRRYWGPLWSLLRWRCELSYWLHNRDFHERARHHARRAEEAFRDGRYGSVLLESARTLLNSPGMAFQRLLCAWMAARGLRILERLIATKEGFTGRHADGWIGPIYRDQLTIPHDGGWLTVKGEHFPRLWHKKVKVRIFLNGRLTASKVVKKQVPFSLAVDVTPYRGHKVTLEITTNSYFVPGGKDRRALSIRLDEPRVATSRN